MGSNPVGAINNMEDNMTKQRKQVSIEFLDHTKKTINDLLATNIPQSAKQKLCIVMEKLLKDTKKRDTDYQYLYWNKYGKLDWAAEKNSYFAKIKVGDDVRVPREYIIGPDDDGSPDFISDIQGEWSRNYF